jgi:DHA2 family multidrug resistance protein
LLDIRLFAVPSFTGANIANIMSMFGLYGGLYLVPIYLQSLRGQTAFEAGLILLPQAFASMATSLIGGILVDKVGTKWIVVPGLAILTLITWKFTWLTLGTPLATFQLYLVIRGFNLGLATQPLNNAPLADLKPKQVSQGSTISSALRSIAASFSVAIMTTLVSTQAKVHYARLAEQVTTNSPAGNFVQQLAAYFMTRGYNAQNAMTAALETVYKKLLFQSYALSVNDAFFLITVVTITSIAVVLISVHDPKKKKSTDPTTEEESLEPVFLH